MKTQISRNSHQPEKGYNGVYQQQGRMLTDADWNELTDIQKSRLVLALKDVIASGAPGQNGLAINADGTIQPGILYVEGWPVTMAGDSPVKPIAQAEYPRPPSFSGKNLRIYADVWERTVTALEDGILLDPALHGADTCTRVHTMLQVKWCHHSKKPEDPAQNPPIGNSELKLKLRKILVADDECDPCATQLELDQRVGNYLFRVEVHDHYRQGGKDFLVLKWSRDNASEQYKTEPVHELPEDFTGGDWVWEFFDLETEKLLGRHYPQNYKPKRGELVTSFAVPVGNKPKDFVRQWDGYCKINLTDNILEEGQDKGTILDPALAPLAHGHIALGGGLLQVNLELMELELSLAGKQFLAGDYWQAEVREAVDTSGDYVLGNASQGGLPAGIYHHYLELGQLDNSGSIVPLTDKERRQFNFPSLTDIQAVDVGFTDHCPALFSGAQNVQEALDNICAIGADDIAYQPPDCTDSVVELLQAALSAWPDLDNDGKTSVRDMLDALLCHLNASVLPYDVPSCGDEDDPTVRSLLSLQHGANNTAKVLDALLCGLNAGNIPLNKKDSICTELDADEVRTVQDALQRLCLKEGGGGCAVSVAPGELQLYLDAFAQGDEEAISLCLQPGEHVIDMELAIAGKQSVKITGSGERASVVQLKVKLMSIEAREIHFEDLGIVFAQAAGQLALTGEVISVEHSAFNRVGSSAGMPPMIQLTGLLDGAGELYWNDNRLSSVWRELATGVDIDKLAPPRVVGAKVNAGLKNIVATESFMYDAGAYKTAVENLAVDVVALSPAKRSSWLRRGRTSLNTVDFSGVNASTGLRPAMESASMRPVVLDTAAGMDAGELAGIAMERLTSDNLTAESAAAGIDDLMAQIVETGYNPVLAISSHRLGGRLEGNRLAGELLFLNEVNKAVDPLSQEIKQVAVDGSLVEPGSDLYLHNNTIVKVISYMESGLVASSALIGRVKGYGSLVVSGNLFLHPGQTLIGGQVGFTGNQLLTVPMSVLGLSIGNWSSMTGNIATNPESHFQCATPGNSRFAESGNLLNIQVL